MKTKIEESSAFGVVTNHESDSEFAALLADVTNQVKEYRLQATEDEKPFAIHVRSIVVLKKLSDYETPSKS